MQQMEFPKGGIIGKARQMIRDIAALRVSVYAAHACYFIVLAVFPSLVLLLGLLRYTGLQVDSLIDLLDGMIPSVFMPVAQRMIRSTYHNTTGMVLSLSALAAFWSAGRGIYGLLTGLNSIYEVQENRGYFYTRGVSVLYTFAFLVVLLLTLVLQVFGNQVLQELVARNSLLPELVDLRFLLLLTIQTALFTLAFTVLPNQKNKIRDSFPGALLASLGWLVFSNLYSVYVKHFTGYSHIYGSVYVVALSMLWLYCCVSILFYGGALNHYLTKRKTAGV